MSEPNTRWQVDPLPISLGPRSLCKTTKYDDSRPQANYLVSTQMAICPTDVADHTLRLYLDGAALHSNPGR